VYNWDSELNRPGPNKASCHFRAPTLNGSAAAKTSSCWWWEVVMIRSLTVYATIISLLEVLFNLKTN
jgi:hypothetical protein